VVVIVTATMYEQSHGPAGVSCDMVGYPRETTADLAAPLGDRAVLEVREGLPVRIIREPVFSS
jgi:hypothetical protein